MANPKLLSLTNQKLHLAILDYRDFLSQPEIQQAFNDMYEEKKRHFREKSFISNGFDNQHLELASIKLSFIATDLHFTELHKEKYKV